MNVSSIILIFVIFAVDFGYCKNLDANIIDLSVKSISSIVKATWDVEGPDTDLISSFDIFIEPANIPYINNISSEARSYIINNVSSSTTYHFCIRGFDDHSVSTLTKCGETLTADQDPVLKNLTVSSVSNTKVSVSYDLIGSKQDVRYFNVSWTNKQGNSDSSWKLTTALDTRVSDLTPGTEYNICVELINAVDLSGGLLCTNITTGGGGDDCPSKFTMIGSKCYHVDIIATWIEARSACESLSLQYGYIGDLAVLSNDTHFNDIMIFMEENDYHDLWVGGFDIGHEGSWKWMDGTPLSLRSTHWHCNSPSLDPNLNCALITDVEDTAAGQSILRTKLIDAVCNNEHRALCQLSVL